MRVVKSNLSAVLGPATTARTKATITNIPHSSLYLSSTITHTRKCIYLVLNLGVVITAAVVWCGIFVYRRIRAYRNADGD